MRGWLVGSVALAGLAGPALAGAWPREEGTAFVSVATLVAGDLAGLVEGAVALDSYTSLYAEYGLTASITLGLEAAYGSGADELVTGLVFLRRPVWRGERDIVAAEIGVGVRHEDGEGTDLRLRTGLAWGRGYDSARGPGWMGLEASLETRPPAGSLVAKLDGTLGLKPRPDTLLILQLQGYREDGDGAIVKLAPSVAWEAAPGRHLQLGLSVGLAGEDGVGVKLGTWFRF